MAPRERNSAPGEKGYDPLDQALADSFPASDPVSATVPTLSRKPAGAPDNDPSKKRDRESQAKGRSRHQAG